MSAERHDCAERVYPSGGFTGHKCSRNGVLEEDGEWWCRQHAPSTKRRKADERRAKFQDVTARETRAMGAATARAEALTAALGIHVTVRSRYSVLKSRIIGYDLVLDEEYVEVPR